MNQNELLIALQESRERFMDAIENLPDSAMLEPGVNGDWSLKDVLAHLSRWEAELVRALWQTRQGRAPTWPRSDQIDALNAQWYAEMRERPLHKVLEDFEGVRNQTMLRVETFNDRQLTDPHAYRWLLGKPLWQLIAANSFEHEAEHLEQIEAWRKNRSP